MTAFLLAALLSLLSLFSPYSFAENAPEKPAEALYLKLGQVGLDPAQVYQVRGAALDRSDVHISLEDGTIAFTQDVMGRITGAFFEGDGEVLIVPPTDVERKSMSLFTGMAILEEHFATAYFRFDDDVFGELRPDLRATEDKQAFVDRWQTTAKNLASSDAMRLLESLSPVLPGHRETSSSETANAYSKSGDRFFHARVQGNNLGVFDIYFDSLAREQVEAGQAKTADNGVTYYNVWTSFSPPMQVTRRDEAPAKIDQKPQEDWVTISHYTIKAEVQPPQIHAQARLELEAKQGKSRVLFFELSRFLQVESVKLNGQPLEFIHNPAVEGTQLARKGDDVMAVILPEVPAAGQKIDLDFVYGGEVLADAGTGLLYVGARGTWYPNRGMAMANFNLEFRYPPGWTLVATGKTVPILPEDSPKQGDGLMASRWVSERPMPFAGFDLGKYKEFQTMAGNVTVETYATAGVERGFPSSSIETTLEPKRRLTSPPGLRVVTPDHPSPSQNEETVGEAAAQAIQYYAERFGPYPYGSLALTQLPGAESQGWPGLVFLSSYAFLNEREREDLHFDRDRILLQESIPAHETAHQWWGDLVAWNSYRDQWFSEGLANYCALMMLQDQNPAGFREIMDKYRRDLVQNNKAGVAPMDAGPVTLGVRLLSSRFPDGYEAISYGRATWLFHMLRSMMKDGAQEKTGVDEPFVRALRKLRQHYEGKSISTEDLMDAFAEELPASLEYEGKKSLDWFLEGWVNGTSLPRFELKAVKFTPKAAGSVVTGTIVQKDAPDDLVTSVPVYAVIGNRQILLGRVFADGEESTFRLTAPAGAHKLVLDPNETILTNPK
jgi:Peptidase family M1 domain